MARPKKEKAEGCVLNIHVWVPAGMRVTIKDVVAFDDAGQPVLLQILGTSVEKPTALNFTKRK